MTPTHICLNIVMRSYDGPPQLRAKTDRAIDRLVAVVNSARFRTLVESYDRYRHHERLTPAEIYNRLMTGDAGGHGDLARQRAVAFDYTILGGEDGTVIGYRNEGTDDIFTYRRRFDELDVDDLASHLGHEVVGHLAGNFGHPRLNIRGRSRSVPYKVDEFIEEVLEADAAGG